MKAIAMAGGHMSTKEPKGTTTLDEKPLGDKDVYPSDDILFSVIGKAKARWVKFFELLAESYPSVTTEWRYYNDGKSWLMKGIHKKKTVFWLGVKNGGFHIVCYFTEKTAAVAARSAKEGELIARFEEGKAVGKLRPVTVTFDHDGNVRAGLELVGLKLAAK